MKAIILSSALVMTSLSLQANELCDSYQSSSLNGQVMTRYLPLNSRSRQSSAQQNTLISDDQVAVTITGNVKKYKDVVLYQLATGNVTDNRLAASKNSEVRFWQVDDPSRYVSTMTDNEGNYQVELSNGQWQGEACGSSAGFSPSAWEVTLANNKLIKMQEITTPSAHIQPINVSLSKNEELIIKGSGFGCNGSIVFEFYNAVDNFGHTKDVEYNRSPIVKKEFCSQTDQQIRLPMPTLMEANVGSSSSSSRIAHLYYIKNGQRSNAIFVSEFNHLPLNPDIEDAADRVKNNDSVVDFTGGLQGLPSKGGFVGVTQGGLYGGNTGFGAVTTTPISAGLLGKMGISQSGTPQTITGSKTSNFGAGQIAVENLSFDKSEINLKVLR